MFGISVYLSKIDYHYIEYAASKGVNQIFTSLHIPEEDFSAVKEKISQLLNFCDNLNIDVICDISPLTFKKLNIKDNDFLALSKFNFKIVRLDFGFDDFKIIKEVEKYFKIMINASTINANYLKKAKEYGLNINNFILSHNFYPKSYTGLLEADLLKINQSYQDFNLNIQAFVAGDKLRRFPYYEGLPTLESHRDTHPLLATIQLRRHYLVDDIIIGDTQADFKTLDFISDFLFNNIINLKVKLDDNYKHLYHQKLKIRSDISTQQIRLNIDRNINVKVNYNYFRKKGSITIDNHLYQRYSGEVCIVKEDLPADFRVNNIGFVHPMFLDILPLILGSDTIILRPF